MTVEASKASLNTVLSWVAKAVPAKPTNPVLAGIHITVKDGLLTAAAFDYEQSAAASMTVEGDDFDVLVSGKLLADVVKSLAGSTVSMGLNEDGRRLTVKSGKSTFGLPIMNKADYPDLPGMPPTLGTVDAGKFAASARQVAAAAGTDSSVPAITGVSVTADPETGIITMAATDRFRLAVKRIPYTPDEGQEEKRTFLVPAKLLEAYAKSFSEADEVTLNYGGISNSLFGVTGESKTATTRLLDGQFPNYEPLIPTVFAAEIEVNKDDLIGAVKRVTLVADKSQAVKLLLEEGSLTVLVGDASSGAQSAFEVLEVDYTGEEELSMTFNPTYLHDGLGNVDSANARMQFVSATKPCLLGSDDTEDSYRYLLMPTRA